MVHEVIYFDGAGRAETIRICLHIAKADWKDTRITFKNWPELKPKTPLGSLPLLKIDDVDHAQSVALSRYAARLAGWYPEDPMEALVVDEAMESLGELASKAPRSKDPDEMKKLREEFQATTMTKFATFLEGMIQRNGGCGFAKKPSVGDLCLNGTVKAVASGNWDYIDAKFFDQFPGIAATVKMVDDNDEVKSYYASKK